MLGLHGCFNSLINTVMRAVFVLTGRWRCQFVFYYLNEVLTWTCQEDLLSSRIQKLFILETLIAPLWLYSIYPLGPAAKKILAQYNEIVSLKRAQVSDGLIT